MIDEWLILLFRETKSDVIEVQLSNWVACNIDYDYTTSDSFSGSGKETVTTAMNVKCNDQMNSSTRSTLDDEIFVECEIDWLPMSTADLRNSWCVFRGIGIRIVYGVELPNKLCRVH